MTTMDDFDKALLYGYELANGRNWFSLSMPNATHFDTVFATLALSGFLEPYPPGSLDEARRIGNRYQRDYQFTPKGLWRVQELTQTVDWIEKAKNAYTAYCSEYDVQRHKLRIYTWDELDIVHQRAWVAAVKAVADSFNMRWTDTDIPVTATE